jgi:hypothetical protein
MSTPTNFHILKVKYLGPTDTRGSRVKITSERFENSKTISYSSEYNRAMDAAINWLSKERGFTVIGTGEGDGHDYVIVSEFQPL